MLLYGVAVVLMSSLRYSIVGTLTFAILLALTPLAFMRPPKKTRHIPSHIRRAVIARDLKGERFDSRIHHLDHIVPFCKGGDNSVKNLRVLYKGDNLRKGAKMPRLGDLLPRD